MVRLLSWFGLCFALGALAGCAPRAPYVADCSHHALPEAGGPQDAASDAAPVVTHAFSIEREQDFAALETPMHEVKYLMRAESGALPGPLAGRECVFSQSVRYPFHLQFIRSLEGLESYSPADYALATERRASRTMVPGSLYWFAGATHPDGSLGVLAYTLSVASAEAPDTGARSSARHQKGASPFLGGSAPSNRKKLRGSDAWWRASGGGRPSRTIRNLFRPGSERRVRR